jgi:catechol 2,3-dioxygenase-like lactoylglutathione lyase family enzyme
MSPSEARPEIQGVHHLKLPVSDLGRSLDFYERLLGARRLPEADHRKEADGALYAYILEVPGLAALLELRLDPEQAERQRCFDPFTLAVKDRAMLERWSRFLDAAGIPHAPILTAIQAWVMVVEDPDGHRLRLYTLERHGRELKPDEDNPWLHP